MWNLNGPSTNLTTSREPDVIGKSPSQPSSDDSRVIVEEIACAIANAQAALLAGRFAELERCVSHQQELCIVLAKLHNDASRASTDMDNKIRLVSAAQRAHQQNKIFGAGLRRMQRHLETLRRVLNGRSLTYDPKPITPPQRES